MLSSEPQDAALIAQVAWQEVGGALEQRYARHLRLHEPVGLLQLPACASPSQDPPAAMERCLPAQVCGELSPCACIP